MDMGMNKKRLLLLLIPILGSFFHACYLFLINKCKFKKSFLAFVCGMISFIVIYFTFALICNAIALDLTKYIWLVYVMFIISGVVWNIIYCMVLSKLEKNM